MRTAVRLSLLTVLSLPTEDIPVFCEREMRDSKVLTEVLSSVYLSSFFVRVNNVPTLVVLFVFTHGFWVTLTVRIDEEVFLLP